jgi:glucose-6-phosphate isomerase
MPGRIHVHGCAGWLRDSFTRGPMSFCLRVHRTMPAASAVVRSFDQWRVELGKALAMRTAAEIAGHGAVA